jgi:uncharacterized protein (DUF2141 family)
MNYALSFRRFIFMVAAPLSVLAVTSAIAVYVQIQTLEVKQLEMHSNLKIDVEEVKAETRALAVKIENLNSSLLTGTSDRYRRADAKIDADRFWASIHNLEKKLFDLAARWCTPSVRSKSTDEASTLSEVRPK